MKNTILILAIIVLAGCTTAQKSEGPQDTSRAGQQKSQAIDVDKLQSALDMDRSADELGYKEKAFNACKLGLSSSQCQNQYLSVIHFRLMCRNSVGTVQSVSNYELTPVVSDNVRWTLGLYKGRASLDEEGYGRIRVITPGSSRSQKLSLQIRDQALGVSANEITRLVLPKDWCE